MAGTGDDNTPDEFRLLADEYDLVYKLTRSSSQLTERVLQGFFAHGQVDPEGRERYQVLYTSAKFLGRLPDGPEGRPIYNQRDPWFWYSDPEKDISCVFEFRDSSMRWTGPMVRPAAPNEDDEDVWEIDPQLKIEYHLEGIKLRHRTLLDFLRRAGLLPTEPPAPEPTAEPSPSEQSQSDSTGAEQSSPPEQPVLREEPQAEETSQESSSEKEEVAATSRPVGNVGGQLSRLQEMRRAGMLKGVRQKMAANWALEKYPPDGDIPSELTASEMAEAIQQWRKHKGLARLADEALRRFCVRFLKAYRKKSSP